MYGRPEARVCVPMICVDHHYVFATSDFIHRRLHERSFIQGHVYSLRIRWRVLIFKWWREGCSHPPEFRLMRPVTNCLVLPASRDGWIRTTDLFLMRELFC